ncbi:MAG: prepilin peptidase [Candidatus Margulisiibacteriota bacterium]
MFYLIILFIVGAVVGSFLNVCIHRLPRGESTIFPASHCPYCNQKLGALDLIPILGYFLLMGKCRYCKAAISFRYPLVEFLGGCLFVVSALKFPILTLGFPFSVVFLSILLVIFFVDLEHLVIPDAVSFSGILLGLGYNYTRALSQPTAEPLNPFLSALYGLLIGYGLFYLVGVLGKILFKKEAVGEGDLYLAALLGACLGFSGVLLAIFISYLLAGAVTLVLLAAGKVKMGDYVPFGPALAGGGVIAFFFGQQIIGWYINLFI